MKTLAWIPVVLLFVAGGLGKASGQTVTLLYSFSGGDGTYPTASLIQGSDGNFYGTTLAGGASTNCSGSFSSFNLFSTTGCGTVFQISSAGTLTTLYSFSGSDGANPIGGLVQGNDGNFYGTTYQGGSNGAGTVFRISSSDTFASIHSFNGSDGQHPYASLLLGRDGNFYGTTYQGGSGNGNVFRITTGGICTNLHSFSGSDGLRPRGGLALGVDGNFYGTTFLGGSNAFPACAGGCGTVFRISPNGNFTNLHSFIHSDGSEPSDSLVQGSDGVFYGTTSAGDCPGICSGENGVVFRISSQGDFAKIFSFADTATSASNHAYIPFAGLMQGSDGLFYGTTPGGGKIYRINPADDTIAVYPIGNEAIYMPYGGVIQGVDGSFYGTSTWGGGSSNCDNGCGVVYKLSVPLSSAPYPVNQITNMQVVATNVVFQVVSVFGETYQLQFSPSMNPTNWGNVAGVSVTNSIGALMTLTNFGGASGPQGFYRFAITP